MEYDLHIFGEVLFDCIGKEEILGGAPFNVAWNLKMLGTNPAFISCVGDDRFGKKIEDKMNSIGLSRHYLQKDDLHESGVVEVTFKENSPQYNIKENVAYDFIELPKIEKSIDLLYYGSLALRNQTSRETLKELKRDAKKIFVDINLRAPYFDREILEFALQDIDFLKINDEELLILQKMFEIENAVELKEQFGLKILVVTSAESGSYLLYQGEKFAAPAPKVKDFKDSVGAGDAFASLLLFAIINHIPLNDAIEKAALYASHICSLKGATTENREFYEDIRLLS